MKSSKLRWKEKLYYFGLGALYLLAVSMLLGATSDYQNSTLNFGRYQISAWSTKIGENSGAVGAFVMDTVSGETRTAYIRTYGDTPPSSVIKNDLKVPFQAMR